MADIKEEVRVAIEQIQIEPNSVLLIKIGTEDYPASPDDCLEVMDLLRQTQFNPPCEVILSHHAMQVQTMHKEDNEFYWVKVGTADYPATAEDLVATQLVLEERFTPEDFLVTDQDVHMESIGTVNVDTLREFVAAYKNGDPISSYVDKFDDFLGGK